MQLIWPVTAFFLLLFRRPKIGSYYNPLFWTWILSYFVPFALLPFSKFSINPLISFSAICIFAISLYWPPPLTMSVTQGFSRLNILTSALVLLLCIVPPVAASFNVDTSSISDFAERNSAIRSLPLQVVILALGSLSTSVWSLSRRRVFIFASLANSAIILISLLSFGYQSSKGLIISILLQTLMVCHIRNVSMCSSMRHNSVIWLNHPVKSPIEHLLRFFALAKIRASVAFLALILPILVLIQLYLLQSFGFDLTALLNRITLNFDTLIYLSDSLLNYRVDFSTSGFVSILAVWAKPFLGLIGFNSLYIYKSVPQYIYSLYFGGFYQESSLGNSNLIAESVVSSNLFIGCLIAPIIFYAFLLVMKRLLSAAGSDPMRLACVLTLTTPYLIFASALEYIMKSAVIGLLLAFCFLIPAAKAPSVNL